MPTEQTLGNLTVSWLTRFFRQQLELFPITSAAVLNVEQLRVVNKLTVVDQVEFSAYQTWKVVGSQGMPSFDNSWANYGAPYANASFMKGPDGFVHLHGVIKSGTVGSDAFVLPPGYRPSALHSLATLSAGVFGRVDIGSDGTVTPIAPSTNPSVVLDGLIFRAA